MPASPSPGWSEKGCSLGHLHPACTSVLGMEQARPLQRSHTYKPQPLLWHAVLTGRCLES